MSIELVDRVTFELSNVCNMGHLHKRCPVSLRAEPQNLPMSVVFQVLDELKDVGYDGAFAFHQYNEPMMDPRLFWFIEKTRAACPDSPILIWTNGVCLDQEMVRELESVGVTSLCITSYGKHSKERHDRLVSEKMVISRFGTAWIEVIGVYSVDSVGYRHPCYAPFTDVVVTRRGEIGLCCRDWQHRYTFGELAEVGFLEIISAGRMRRLYEQLNKGTRTLDLCKRCDYYRDWRATRRGSRTVRHLER